MVRPPAKPSISSAPDAQNVAKEGQDLLYALMAVFFVLSLLVVRQNLAVGLFALAATILIFWPLLQPVMARLRLLFACR